MKNYLIILCSSLFLQFTSVPKILQKAAETINKFPQSRELLASIEEEGPITLEWAPCGKELFYACWIGEERIIVLNSSKQWTEGKKISSILFELHNAKRDAEFINLNKLAFFNQISKEEYVETVENYEYLNAVMTKELVDKGIRLGFFPKDASLPIYKDFAEHYRWQIELGHSALIAQQYDSLRQEADSV